MDHIIFVASFVNHLISDTEKFDMDERQKERPHCLANNAALRFGDYEWTSSLATRGQYLPLCSYILYFRSFNTNVHSPQSSKKKWWSRVDSNQKKWKKSSNINVYWMSPFMWMFQDS